jgi:hypothetical protein
VSPQRSERFAEAYCQPRRLYFDTGTHLRFGTEECAFDQNPDAYEMAWPPRPDTEGEPRQAAARVLAARRRGEAEAVLAAARESPRRWPPA